MIQNKQKIYMIAGEASGDFIGSKIMTSLKQKKPNLIIQGIGGSYMEECGLQSLFHISNINLIGFWEIIPHIFRIKKLISKTVENIIETAPDLIITIDSPGFNFRVVKSLRNQGYKGKIIHIVAPTVWAYDPERAITVSKLYDRLLTLLPFEPPLFTKYGLATDFIGHPIFEQNFNRNINFFRQKYNISENTKILCVTPGSRKSEIIRHMKIFSNAIQILNKNFNIFTVFALQNEADRDLAMSQLDDSIKYATVIGNERIDAYAAADLALAKSGTNNLEMAACATPLIVAYKVNYLTYWYIKSKVLIDKVCLINILLQKNIVPELIQSDCNETDISNVMAQYLSNDVLSENQVRESERAIEMLGFNSKNKPSNIAADIIIQNYLN